MKKQFLFLCAGTWLLMSCENPMTFQTKVNEDGSLDKTIVFEKADEKVATFNIFGVNEKNGWALQKQLIQDLSKKEESKKYDYRIQFSKHFSSSEEMNSELNKSVDTLFRVQSKFEKRFRWFYTYIRYSETIRPINRFKMVSAKDFFNLEDSLFIQRLPSEGRAISKADSLALLMLNEKISDRFGNMAIFKEIYKILEDVIRKNNVDKKWLDTLQKNQELIYHRIEKDKGDVRLAEKIADTLKIPLKKQQASFDFVELSKDLNSRINFMSYARDGKYVNEFEMPWNIVTSNADSVAGKKLIWRPLVNKFVYMDYEMYAESRKINWWAVIVSIIIVGATVFGLRKRPN